MRTFNVYWESWADELVAEGIEATSKEQALLIFFNDNNIPEDEIRGYYAVDKQKHDEDKALLKEAGYSSWDEYHKDMYPSRPIEF